MDGTHDARRRARLPPPPFIPSWLCHSFLITASVILGFEKVIPEHRRLRPQVLHFGGIHNILHLPGLFTHAVLLRKQEQDGADGGGNNNVL